MFPLMLVAIAAGEQLLGASANVRTTLISALNGTNSETVRGMLEDTLTGVQQGAAERSHWGIILGLVGALFGASGIFLELEAALNKLFHVRPPKRTFWQEVKVTLRERAASLGLVMATSVLLLLGTFVLAGADVVAARLPLRAAVLPGMVTNLASLLLTSAALALCYQVVPAVRVRWQAAALGGVLATLALYIVRWPLTFAVVHLTSYSAYGVVGVLLVLMTWLYVASCILLFGASVAAVQGERLREAKEQARGTSGRAATETAVSGARDASLS
jgi:membrane protein